MTNQSLPIPASEPRTDDDAKRAVTGIVGQSRTSFYWSMRILPKPQREAMFAVYAFCRAVDDVADDDNPIAEKHAALTAWRHAIGKLFQGQPDRPITQALLEPVNRYGLRQEDFLAVLDGMAMDAAGPVVAPPLETLLLYCARVAGAVGALSLRIFGPDDPRNARLSIIQGEAVQLTNILRDLYEDAQIGRLYLPLEYLRQAGIANTDPMDVLQHPDLAAVLHKIADMAEARFIEARRLIGERARTHLRPAMVILMVYWALLRHMRRSGFGIGPQKPRLSKMTKLWTALRYGFL